MAVLWPHITFSCRHRCLEQGRGRPVVQAGRSATRYGIFYEGPLAYGSGTHRQRTGPWPWQIKLILLHCCCLLSCRLGTPSTSVSRSLVCCTPARSRSQANASSCAPSLRAPVFKAGWVAGAHGLLLSASCPCALAHANIWQQR